MNDIVWVLLSNREEVVVWMRTTSDFVWRWPVAAWRETGRGDCSCSTWLHKVSLPGGVEPGPVTLPIGFSEREEPGNGYSGGYMGDIG